MSVDPQTLRETDHERIWLEPLCCCDFGREPRQWCEDNVWPNGDCDIDAPGVEYVRGDKYATLLDQIETQAAEIARLRTALENEIAEAFLAGWNSACDSNEYGHPHTEEAAFEQFVAARLALGEQTK